MKKHTLTALAAALALAPALIIAADPVQPGKSGADSASKPKQEPAAAERGKNPAPDRTQDAGKSGDASTAPQPGANKFQGKITAVDKAAQTITINDKDKGQHTIHVGENTKGAMGSTAATWNELTVGQEVKGTCRKDGDKFHAESLSVSK